MKPCRPEHDQHLTPTDVVAQALTAAGLLPRPPGPGVRHFRLNSPEAEEALYDPRKREFGYVPMMVRPGVAEDDVMVGRPKYQAERELARKRPKLG